MGACCPCYTKRNKYHPVPEGDVETTVVFAPVNGSSLSNAFHSMPDQDTNQSEFDMTLPVFRGMVLQQKFHNKSTYDTRFAWINLQSRALCLSEYNSTSRRHKEASLADVTGVIAGPPEKYKTAKNPEAPQPNWDTYLSVKFIRGGGIDLKFDTREERDLWCRILLRLISQQLALESSNHSDPPVSWNGSSTCSSSLVGGNKV